MNSSSLHVDGSVAKRATDATVGDARPILMVPYMWIGDFVRCHTAVRLLKQRWPNRPVDVLTTRLCAPLLEFMPGVRKGIVSDLPRKRLAFAKHRELAARLRTENYGTAVVMLRTWKSALAPALAGIPERIGFLGEMRFGLLTDWRLGEKTLPRMVDRCGALTLPRDAPHSTEWPAPQIVVGHADREAWRTASKLPPGPAVALAPGSVGSAKRWTGYAEAAKRLTAAGVSVWVVGGPGERTLARDIVEAAGPGAYDVTGDNLRNGILALAAADAAVTNDSGLLHVSAAIGTPTVGIFGPTSAYHWAPLNPLAAIVETRTEVACRPCHRPICREGHHRCMTEIPAATVADAALAAIAQPGPKQP